MKNLLLDEYPLIILPSLAVQIGLNEAIILQQLHYWLQKSDKEIDGQKWIYATYEQWQQQFPFWSERTIRRTLTNLESQGLILTSNHNKMKIDRTKWYTINYQKLSLVARPSGQIGQSNRTNWPDTSGQFDHTNNQRLQETTTDIDVDEDPAEADSSSTQEKSNPKYSDNVKEIYKYFKDKLIERGVTVFPRDYHLKQYAVINRLLQKLSKDELIQVIDWGFNHEYWSQHIDSMYTIERIGPRFQLQKQQGTVSQKPEEKEEMRLSYRRYVPNYD